MTDNRALLNLEAIRTVFDHQVAPLTELHALGISAHAIYERCRPGGPWQRLKPNLVLLTDEPPNRTQLIQAALTAAGDKAVLTGIDALKLHGMSGAHLISSIHILVPARRQPGLVDGAYFERTHQLPEPLHLGGFPVAPLARATVDTCRRTKHPGYVEALLAETIYKGRITPATLRAELDRGALRGAALPRRKLAEIDDKVRSIAQGWAKRLVQQAGLPTPTWRVPITSPNGTHVATADAWWDEVGLAWEVDSYAFDLSPADATAALTRAARLTASGVLVVHTSPTQLREEPAKVADLLRGAYARAAARPRPEVKAQCSKPSRPQPPNLQAHEPEPTALKPTSPEPAKPEATETVAAETVAPEPKSLAPESESESTEPEATEPEPPEPTEPESLDPQPADPVSGKPAPTEPQPTEPEPHEPEPTEPEPTEPARSESESSEPQPDPSH